ncbi:phage holin family protein [Variovorax sp. J22R115]|uniref:phage holin family protein n=1 Tax=Variovorax sp. J22R115 TaxID=3053509 RepID=UPI002575D8F3|nr:phage holin family protein [Variovorax sp. J22R115]MDM0048121.1 phage holin family protein [Variovorax sp. J22R115]
MRVSSLFGLKGYLRRLRILAGEGALAAEDRAQLLRFAWQDERKRLKSILGLVIAVIGLTTVAIALLSVAIVVHFWETPHRITAAWLVAAMWVGLWLAAVVVLMSMLSKSSEAFDPAREAFERDLAWIQESLGRQRSEDAARQERPATREELLARIERQRERIATLQAAATGAGEAPSPRADESASATAMRLAREHPIATGVAAATVVAVVGPRRLVRWASVIVPVIWRMR